jgi:hypothetical protein
VKHTLSHKYVYMRKIQNKAKPNAKKKKNWKRKGEAEEYISVN